MFELSIARRYLFPRWRQISVSIISILSTLVIALVVWLIVVFFSVKDGLESGWINTIVALTAPVRVTPTEHYFKSYYYLADTISNSSNYTVKTLAEKKDAPLTDPYNPEEDEEIPSFWPHPDRLPDGSLIDPVKQAFALASSLPGESRLSVSDYETAVANLTIHLDALHAVTSNTAQRQTLEQVVYLGSLDPSARAVSRILLPPAAPDVAHMLNQLLATHPSAEQLLAFFNAFQITELQTPTAGWKLPPLLLPSQARWKGIFLPHYRGGNRLFVPVESNNTHTLLIKFQKSGIAAEAVDIAIENGQVSFATATENFKFSINDIPLFLEGDVTIPASIAKEHLKETSHLGDIPVSAKLLIQGSELNGEIRLNSLPIAAIVPSRSNGWSGIVNVSPKQEALLWPSNSSMTSPILLPKVFKEAGALIGDKGYLTYYSPTPSAVQEQRIPVFIAGFYDPGIMPIGSKYVIGPKTLVSEVHGAIPNEQATFSNGINIRFDDFKNAPHVKNQLKEAFEAAGIAPYWKIETYQEFEYTKDLIQQLSSEKNLFSLISLIIIIVACSNIISMLIILVNDKKIEIGILRSMGATWAHIATIFGFCGMVIGALGSLIGIGASILTLHYINELVDFLGRLQGYDLFNPVYYGSVLPTQLSVEALALVFVATAIISLLAGMVPAIKASLLRPSAILRAE